MRNYMVEWRSGLKEQRQASGTQRVNAVIRSAAALRAPLTSLQNVKKNPRTLPNICQQVIKKYQKGCQQPSKSESRESKKQCPKQNTNTSRFVSSPWCQNALLWRPFYQKSSKCGPKAPKKIQKNSKHVNKKQPKRHPETSPKPNPEIKTLIFLKWL